MLSRRRLWKSFRYAQHGLKRVAHEEQNFAVELFIGLLAVILAILLKFGFIEWAILLLTIGFVLLAELLNSAVERVSDLLKPRLDIGVKEIKDIMAASVFVTAVIAVAVGCLLFVQPLFNFVYQHFQ
jgi:diacylglycerol kinase